MPLSSKHIRAIPTVLLLILSHICYAQLQLYPAYPAPVGTSSSGRGNASGRTKETVPLKLPFFDDFSKPVGKIRADTALWTQSSSVWVNDGMAIHPPTINVATFDGLNASGMPYSPNEVLLTGYTDTLMSKPIDLSEASVSVLERSTVYLSFFYQWQGNLEPPDEKDFLELSFKTAEDGWVTVMTILPKEESDPTVFYDTIIQVTGDEFFHDKFQFRIRAYGKLSGPYDTWHVDYVYLNKRRAINDLSFPDRAISTQLGPLFGKYRAIPRRHFLSNDQMTFPTFEVQNMKSIESPVNFALHGLFVSTDRKDNISYPQHQVVLSDATPVKITDNVLQAYEHASTRTDALPDIADPLQFPPDPGIDSTLVRLTVALQTRDNVPFNYMPPIEADSTGDYTWKSYSPIRFTTNDTLSADYVLSDYFAYDDGVAEYAAGLVEAGNLVAYAFELDTSYSLKQDTLVAIDVYFPPYAITSNQRVDFFIYHEDTTQAKAGYPGNQWLRIISKPVLRKGLNEFQRIEFLPALLIDEKKFFIGWQEPVAGNVMVGLDISNDTGDKIFVNTNGFWYQNDVVKGSLMVRPVFGSGVIDTRVGVEDEPELALYPNPNHGTFYIEGEAGNLQIFSMTGSVIPFKSMQTNGRTEIVVGADVPGMYLVRYRQGKAIRSRKIILLRE